MSAMLAVLPELLAGAFLLAGPVTITALWLRDRARTDDQSVGDGSVLDRIYGPQRAPVLPAAQGFYGADLARPLVDEINAHRAAIGLSPLPAGDVEPETFYPESAASLKRMRRPARRPIQAKPLKDRWR